MIGALQAIVGLASAHAKNLVGQVANLSVEFPKVASLAFADLRDFIMTGRMEKCAFCASDRLETCPTVTIDFGQLVPRPRRRAVDGLLALPGPSGASIRMTRGRNS
jgi:hypothetical protein